MSDSLQPHGLFVPCQVPLPIGFCSQEYWGELPFPPLGELPGPGQSSSLMAPASADGLFTTSTTWDARIRHHYVPNLENLLLICVTPLSSCLWFLDVHLPHSALLRLKAPFPPRDVVVFPWHPNKNKGEIMTKTYPYRSSILLPGTE